MVGVTTAWGAVWKVTALGRARSCWRELESWVAGFLLIGQRAEFLKQVWCFLQAEIKDISSLSFLPVESSLWVLPLTSLPAPQQMIRNCHTCCCVYLPRWACVLCVGAQDLRNSGSWKSSRFTVERYEQCGVAALHTRLRLSCWELGWRGFTWAQPGQHSEILPQKTFLSENILILLHMVLPL